MLEIKGGLPRCYHYGINYIYIHKYVYVLIVATTWCRLQIYQNESSCIVMLVMFVCVNVCLGGVHGATDAGSLAIVMITTVV